MLENYNKKEEHKFKDIIKEKYGKNIKNIRKKLNTR